MLGRTSFILITPPTHTHTHTQYSGLKCNALRVKKKCSRPSYDLSTLTLEDGINILPYAIYSYFIVGRKKDHNDMPDYTFSFETILCCFIRKINNCSSFSRKTQPKLFFFLRKPYHTIPCCVFFI